MDTHSLPLEFQLDRVAARLEGLEETIIFRLLDRAQFALNPDAYRRGTSGFAELAELSLMEARLFLHESMDSQFGRYLVPEERPFSSGLPPARRCPPTALVSFPVADIGVISQCGAIRQQYLSLLHRLCLPQTDGHLGSVVELDVHNLQAIARRIHYGALYVAESKFLQNQEGYTAMILQARTDLAQGGERGGGGLLSAHPACAGLLAALTRPEVEARILDRVRDKIESIQSRVNLGVRRTVEPQILLPFYRDTVIPLTKEGELAYLLARLPGDNDGR